MNIDELKQTALKDKIPIMSDEVIAFILSFLKNNSQIKEVLEIGSAYGYSALCFSEVKHIHIDTLEIDKKRYLKALGNIELMNKKDAIDIYFQDALSFKTHKIYDLIIVDGAKSQYQHFFEYYQDNTHRGSFFIFDNLNFHGMVKDPSLTHNRHTKGLIKRLQQFNNYLLNIKNYNVQIYKELGDGLAILERII